MSAIFSIYREPMFWLFPVYTTAISMIAFLIFSVPYTLLAWMDPPSVRKYRIQQEKSQSAPFIVPRSVGRWLSNNLIYGVIAILSWPLLRLGGVHAGPADPLWLMALHLTAFLFLDDFAYYWMHRAMHSRLLYKRFHAIHHRLHAPWAIGAHYMHPVEFILTAGLVTLWPMLLGAHVYTVWLWVTLRQYEAADGHCGYDFPWNPGRWIPFYHGGSFHDFHHSKFRGNYAGFLDLWDRVFGTYAAGYPEYRREREALDAASLERIATE